MPVVILDVLNSYEMFYFIFDLFIGECSINSNRDYIHSGLQCVVNMPYYNCNSSSVPMAVSSCSTIKTK